jgi:hypothetical protein
VLAAVFLIEVQQGRIVRQRTEEHVVRLGHRAAQRVLEHLADRQLVEIKTRHLALPLRS